MGRTGEGEEGNLRLPENPLVKSLSRVCDDAERWNAQHGWVEKDNYGYQAIETVRRYKNWVEDG